MKRIIIILSLVFALVACGGGQTAEVSSNAVDSTVVDTLNVDTTVVDTVVIDSTVC